MWVGILGTNCDRCRSMVQCCFTSTETVRLIRTESPGRPPQSTFTQLLNSEKAQMENADRDKGGPLAGYKLGRQLTVVVRVRWTVTAELEPLTDMRISQNHHARTCWRVTTPENVRPQKYQASAQARKL